MAEITEQTPAEVIAGVKAHRLSFAVAEREAKLPFDDRSGGIASGSHVVTAAEDTAGTLDIGTGLTAVESEQLTITAVTTDILKMGDQIVTRSGGSITVADGAIDKVVEGDIIRWSAKGTGK